MVYKLSQENSEATRFAQQGMAYPATRVASEVTAKVQRGLRASNSLRS